MHFALAMRMGVGHIALTGGDGPAGNGETEMFELCAFLAPKKVAKVRKASGPSIKIGCKVFVYGHEGVVTGKHETNKGWWNVSVGGKVVGFDRCAIDVVG